MAGPREASPMTLLEEEIESWKGFPWAPRKEDRDLWAEMIDQVRQYYADAVEKSGKPLTTDPFFMALLLAQQRTIEFLKAQLKDGHAPALRPHDTCVSRHAESVRSRSRTDGVWAVRIFDSEHNGEYPPRYESDRDEDEIPATH